MSKAQPSCAANAVDVGVALDTAATRTQTYGVDTRIMFSPTLPPRTRACRAMARARCTPSP